MSAENEQQRTPSAYDMEAAVGDSDPSTVIPSTMAALVRNQRDHSLFCLAETESATSATAATTGADEIHTTADSGANHHSAVLTVQTSLYGVSSQSPTTTDVTQVSAPSPKRYAAAGSHNFKGSLFLADAAASHHALLKWSLQVSLRHFSWICAVGLFYAVMECLPMQYLYEERQSPIGSGMMFAASQTFVAIAISFSAVFWLKSILNVPYGFHVYDCWKPGLTYMTASCLVYSVIALCSLWPLPFLPIYGGGGLYAAIIPAVVFLTMSPEWKSAVKAFSWKDPQFRKFVRATLVVCCMNAYYFVLLLFYFLFVKFHYSSVIQVIIVVVFKLISAFFIFMRCFMCEYAVMDPGALELDPEFKPGSKSYIKFRKQAHVHARELAAYSKFEIQAMSEVYFALCLPSFHGWDIFAFTVIGGNIILFFELCHEKHTNLEGLIALMKKPFQKDTSATASHADVHKSVDSVNGTESAFKGPIKSGSVNFTSGSTNVASAITVAQPEGPVPQVPQIYVSDTAAPPPEPKALASKKALGSGIVLSGSRSTNSSGSRQLPSEKLPECYTKLSAAYLSRIEFYFLGFLAKLFGIIMYFFLLPVICYGPNNEWFGHIFAPDEVGFSGSMLKGALTLLGLMFNFAIGSLFVSRKTKGVSVQVIGMSLLDGVWLKLIISLYWIAPVFAYSQLGKQFMVVYFFTESAI